MEGAGKHPSYLKGWCVLWKEDAGQEKPFSPVILLTCPLYRAVSFTPEYHQDEKTYKYIFWGADCVFPISRM